MMYVGFEKSLYARTYVRQKLMVMQKYFITSTLWSTLLPYSVRHAFHLVFDMF